MWGCGCQQQTSTPTPPARRGGVGGGENTKASEPRHQNSIRTTVYGQHQNHGLQIHAPHCSHLSLNTTHVALPVHSMCQMGCLAPRCLTIHSHQDRTRRSMLRLMWFNALVASTVACSAINLLKWGRSGPERNVWPIVGCPPAWRRASAWSSAKASCSWQEGKEAIHQGLDMA